MSGSGHTTCTLIHSFIPDIFL